MRCPFSCHRANAVVLPGLILKFASWARLACRLPSTVLKVVGNTIFTRYNGSLSQQFKIFASNTRIALALSQTRHVRVLARAAVLARHWRRLRHLLKELTRNARCALTARCASRLILMLACGAILAFVRPDDVTKFTSGTSRLGSTSVANEPGRACLTHAICQCAIVYRA